jgi:SAM-dependent methyltransferase
MERSEYAIMFRAETTHWWYAGLRAMLDFAWEKYPPQAALRLLDAGCGTGANLTHFQSRTNRVYGIDLSPDALHHCVARRHHTLARASAATLPFPDGIFDVVLSCDVLYHQGIADPIAALRELRRVLKPGGLLLLNLPAYQWLYSSHDRSVHTARRFTKAKVMRMVAGANFDLAYTTYWNTLLFPAIAAARLWRKLKAAPASDLDSNPDSPLAHVAAGLLQIERAILRVMPLPFGLSVFCVATCPNRHD